LSHKHGGFCHNWARRRIAGFASGRRRVDLAPALLNRFASRKDARGEDFAVSQPNPRFALNHVIAPRFGPEAFFALAAELGIDAVEIRNDIAENAILDGTPPRRIRKAAEDSGVRILSINALQRFDDWRGRRPIEAVALLDYAKACGARAVVLVPTNDGSMPDRLRPALEGLRPLLQARGLTGLVEPLGFASCSLRLKSVAASAIAEVGGHGVYRLVHDTFHHHLAGETATFPKLTGLVHISGVDDPDLAVGEMRDAHRLLVTPADRLGNVAQVRELLAGGYDGYLSFEPFAAEVQALEDPAPAIRKSMEVMREGPSVAAV
jgi:2-keto-myo-inositol isomerase